jgi:hypothetical protein
MLEKIKTQKGFIPIPLLITIIAAIIFVSIATVGVVLYKQGKLNNFIGNKQTQQVAQEEVLKNEQELEKARLEAEKPKTISCARTVRLDNKPQYDRALSLIQQRIDENHKYWTNAGEQYQDMLFINFPPELVNCIKISEEDTRGSTGVEGYFTFNGQDIKKDYYPITVSTDYGFTDDIVTALLLSHEMTHVQQYMDALNGKNSLSCIDSEIDAFIAQLDFYGILNDEEISSVYYRIHGSDEVFLHPQLKMLDTMLTINRESGCGFRDLFKGKDSTHCVDINLRNKLREILTDDSYYRKQCGL